MNLIHMLQLSVINIELNYIKPFHCCWPLFKYYLYIVYSLMGDFGILFMIIVRNFTSSNNGNK